MAHFSFYNFSKAKNFLKVILFCIITALPLIVIVWFTKSKTLYFMDNEYPYWKQNEDFIRQGSQGNFDVVALGDSTSNGMFVPQIFGKSFYNLSIGGASPVTIYYTMETYLKHHKPPKLAFIAFRNTHFVSQGCLWTRTMYFNYLSTNQEIDLFKSIAPLDKTGFSMENWFTDWMQYKFRWPTKYLPALNNAGFRNRESGNNYCYKICVENRGKYIGIGNFSEKSDGLASDCHFSNFKICAINEFYLRRLINLLKENNVTVIVEQLPFNETSFFKIAEKVKQDEKEFYANLQNEFGIQSNSKLFYYDDFCFLDGHHLNYRGAAKYSHYICKKYADLLAPYRSDKTARYNELLGYARGIAKTENGLLETLNDDIFSLRIFVKRDFPTASIQYKILSEMDNFEFANSPKGFYSPIETEHFIIEARMKE